MALQQSFRLLSLNGSGRKRHYAIAERGLDLPEILTDQVKIGVELPGVFHAVLAHFVYEWVFHDSSPRKASGGTISGHSYPAFSTACRIIILVNGLLMCEKFQVTMNSIPDTAATAM